MPRHPSRQGSGRLTPALQIRRIAARLPSGSSPAPAPRLCSRPGRRAEADRPPDAPGPVTRPSRQVYRPRALADRPGVEALHKLRGGVPACCAVRPPCGRASQPFLFTSLPWQGTARPIGETAARPCQAALHNPDGRIFQTARGGIIQDSACIAVWDQARKQALTPAQWRSPLGRRPYGLRRAAV